MNTSGAYFFSIVFHLLFAAILLVATTKVEMRPKGPQGAVVSAVFREKQAPTALVMPKQKTHENSATFPKPKGSQKSKTVARVEANDSRTAGEKQDLVHLASSGSVRDAGDVLGNDGVEHGSDDRGIVRQNPTLINKDEVKVPYPEMARQLMIEGIVRMRLTVSEAGRVIDAQIVSGPYYGLRNAALLVARRLFFLPATDENGQAKTAKVDHEVIFRLNKRS